MGGGGERISFGRVVGGGVEKNCKIGGGGGCPLVPSYMTKNSRQKSKYLEKKKSF